MVLNTLIKNWWKSLYLVAVTGIIFMWISAFVLGETIRDHVWKEQLILPFYFTYISNFMALILGFVKGFTKYSSTKVVKRLEVLTTVNLTVTFLVYWAMLFPAHQPDKAFVWITNMTVHLIVPLLTIALFLVQNLKDSDNFKFKNLIDSAWHMIFVFGYFALAVIIYYALGGAKEDAVYGFINLNGNAWYMTLIYIVGIGGAYFGLTYLGYFILSRKVKKS